MTAPDQTFYDFEFTHSNRGIHTLLCNILAVSISFPSLISNPSLTFQLLEAPS